MSRTKSLIIRSIRAGATTAVAAVVVAVLAGIAASTLAAPGATHAEAAGLAPDAFVDRVAAVPQFVAPTPAPARTAEPTPERPPADATIHAARINQSEDRPDARARATAPSAPVATHGRNAIIEAIYAVWPSHLAATAVVIAECESSMNPAAVNPSSGAAGLFQALGHGSVPADAYGQSVQALAIYNEQGSWRPWTASVHCWG